MKVIKISNDDYLGHVDIVRHACRGIVIKQGKILLGYEKNNNQYIIPGGGVEDNETFPDCCRREIIEETGIVCSVKEHFVDIDELFANMNHINHYFICEVIKETSQTHLTQTEQFAALTFVWMDIYDALSLFVNYNQYKDVDIARFGLYRREFLAIKTYIDNYDKQA